MQQKDVTQGEVVEVDFDHQSPEVARDRSAAFRQLRETCPVVRSTSYGGFYVLSDWESVHFAAGNPTAFSSQPGALIPTYPQKMGMLDLDPPDGPAIRRGLSRLFSRSAAQAARPRIQQVVDEHIDRFIEHGTCDLVEELTGPVSAQLTAESLGAPVESASEWSRLIRDLLSGRFGEGDLGALMARYQLLLGDLSAVIDERAMEPKDDWLSALLAMEIDGNRLSKEEVLQNADLIFAGGVDTTSATTAWGLVHLHRDRALRERLQNDPSAMAAAVEEILRFYTPFTTSARTITREVEIAGVKLEPGKRALLAWTAANRDPARFPNPDEFNIDRQQNRHLTFGHGNHKCIGQHLARVQIDTMVSTVLRRMPDYVIDESTIQPNIADNGGVRNVLATFTPGRRLP